MIARSLYIFKSWFMLLDMHDDGKHECCWILHKIMRFSALFFIPMRRILQNIYEIYIQCVYVMQRKIDRIQPRPYFTRIMIPTWL